MEESNASSWSTALSVPSTRSSSNDHPPSSPSPPPMIKIPTTGSTEENATKTPGSGTPTPRKKKELTTAQKIKAAAIIQSKLAKQNVAEKSFYCMDKNHPLRRRALAIVQSSLFENFSMLIILANCACLAIFDPLDYEGTGPRNTAIADAELPFNILFTIEMLIKIIALGFVGKNTYLGDKWNWLDFFIVVMGYVGMIPGMSNFSALRTFRVLRPLRTLSTMPGMRVIVGSILAAVPALGNVVLLAFFTLLVFGIIGIQLWSGLLRGHCGYIDPNDNTTWVWTETFCALSCAEQVVLGANPNDCTDSYGDTCPSLYVPYINYDNNNNAIYTSMTEVFMTCKGTDNPGSGTVAFDNIGIAALTIFMGITLEGWTDTMYAIMETWGVRPFVAGYFIILIVFGAFFMLQLALAVIWESYQQSEEDEATKADRLLAEYGHLLPRKKKKKTVAEGLMAAGRSFRNFRVSLSSRSVNSLSPEQREKVIEDVDKATASAFVALMFRRTTAKVVPVSNEGSTNETLSKDPSYLPSTTALTFPPPAIVTSSTATDELNPSHNNTKNNDTNQQQQQRSSITASTNLTEFGTASDPKSDNSTATLHPSHHQGFAASLQQQQQQSSVPSSSSSASSSSSSSTVAPAVPPNTLSNLLTSEDISDDTLKELGVTPLNDNPPVFPDNNHVKSLTALFKTPSKKPPVSSPTPSSPSPVPADSSPERSNSNGNNTYALQARTQSGTGSEWDYDIEDDTPPPVIHKPLIPSVHNFVEHPKVGAFIMFVILLNTIQLAMPYKNMSDEYSFALDVLNYIFSAIFGLEMVLKLIGSGPRIYCSSSFNIFDGFVVIMSFVDIALTQILGDSAGGLTALRTLRLARIFKLARKWEDLRKVMTTIILSIANVSNAVIVLGIIMFIFTLLGMQLLGGQYQAAVTAGALADLPRTNWDTFWWGFVSTFQIVTGENWNGVVADSYAAVGGIAILYLIALNVVGSYVFLNLFLAILLGCFEASMEAELETRKALEEEEKKAKEAAEKANALLLDGNVTQVTTPPESTKPDTTSPLPPPQPVTEIQMADLRKHPGSTTSLSPNQQEMNRSNATQGGGNTEASAKLDMANGAPKQFQANLSTVGPDGLARQVAIKVLPSGDVQIAQVTDDGTGSLGKRLSSAVSYAKLNLDATPDSNGNFRRDQISLGCLTPANPLRKLCAIIVTNPLFDKLILFLILISSINLALDEPRVAYCGSLPADDPGNCIALSRYLAWADIIITAVFVGEMVMKIIALGFYLTPAAYLKSSWNVLDFVIVIISVLSLILAEAAAQLKALRSLRALRALRPLRVVSRYPGLKLVVNSVLTAIPKVKTVVLINFLFFLILAIVGLQNFSGALDYCNDPDVTDFADCTGTFTLTGDMCTLMPTGASEDVCRRSNGTEFPRMINTYYQNYDNVFQAILTVFEVSTGEGWPNIMYYAVDATGPGLPQTRDANQGAALYFIMIQLVCGFFLLELFTGIIIANYDELKELNKGSGLLTAEQQLWVEQMKLMLSSKPSKQMLRPTLPKSSLFLRKLRNRFYDVATHTVFDVFIMIVIFANTVVLAMKYFGQPDSYIHGIERANDAFALIFACEALIKLTAFGPKQYFSVNWNRFDFTLVVASALGVAFSLGPLATLLRVFRVARVFRLIRTSKGLLLLFKTLIVSLPSLANVGTILILIYYIFGIVGMNLFAGVRYGWFGGGLGPESNFDSFFTSMLTLFRSSTGENFNAILHDLEVAPPYCIETGDEANCGNKTAPAIYYTLFQMLTDMIMIKLLVAVVLDSFSDALEAESAHDEFRLTPDIVEHYTEVWERCDPSATKFVDENGLIKLVCELHHPLGLKNSPGVRHDSTVRKQAITMIAEMELRPDTEGRYQFHTVLQELSKHASGGKELVSTRLELSGVTQQEYSAREQLMAIRIQGVFRARQARKHLAERRRLIAAGELVLPKQLSEKEQLDKLKLFRRGTSSIRNFATMTKRSLSSGRLLGVKNEHGSLNGSTDLRTDMNTHSNASIPRRNGPGPLLSVLNHSTSDIPHGLTSHTTTINPNGESQAYSTVTPFHSPSSVITSGSEGGGSRPSFTINPVDSTMTHQNTENGKNVPSLSSSSALALASVPEDNDDNNNGTTMPGTVSTPDNTEKLNDDDTVTISPIVKKSSSFTSPAPVPSSENSNGNVAKRTSPPPPPPPVLSRSPSTPNTVTKVVTHGNGEEESSTVSNSAADEDNNRSNNGRSTNVDSLVNLPGSASDTTPVPPVALDDGSSNNSSNTTTTEWK